MIEIAISLIIGFFVGTSTINPEDRRIRAIETAKHSTIGVLSSSMSFYDLKQFPINMLSGLQKSGAISLATGSGVIVTEDGYVITNKHVVRNGKFFQVRLYGEIPTENFVGHKALLIGMHPHADLAVLKIEGTHKPATVDSGTPILGESVVTIGSPLGLLDSVTFGIVSNVCRRLALGISFICGIQTDADINKGNSGGGLFNLDGELLGITTSIYTTTGASVGLGVALNAETMVRLAKEIISQDKVHVLTKKETQ